MFGHSFITYAKIGQKVNEGEEAILNFAIDGTTGTPLGGFGAGAVKFCAHAGTFATMTKPPADAYDYRKMDNFKFQMFTQRGKTIKTVDRMKAQLVEGRSDDDAIWPLHLVNFGTVNDIQVNLTAFAPFDNIAYEKMSMPYAFYEFTCTNQLDSEVIAAVAFQIESDLEGFTYIENKGIKNAKWAIYAKSSDSNGVISAGNDEDFFTAGENNNNPQEAQSRVAVKFTLKPHEVKTIQFVLAWYDNSDPERCFYLGCYDEPGAIAELGLNNFEHLKNNATTLVTRMRESNLPQWFINQTLNTLANLTNNSMYKRDGRVAFAEGQWTCFGTMDQMWHARQIINQLVPEFAWQELEYWARTQKASGQIHHDFNDYKNGSDNEKAALSTLVAWDDAEHSDYRMIDTWVDLNCGLIISVYETFIATNNRERLNYFWPYLKKAGQRILDQVKLYGNPDYPYTFDTSENSYDAGGDPNPYNASLSAVAYKIMALLAQDQNDHKLTQLYNDAYNKVVSSYRARYLNDNFPVGSHSESYFAGQWLSLHLRLGEIWTATETDYVLEMLDNYYHPYSWGMGTLKGTYNEWTPYILTHYGGLLLHTRRTSQWYVMQNDAYRRQYSDRNLVFNHPLDVLPAVNETNFLATEISGDKQYISMPGIWRNYSDVVGYYRNSSTNEIWIQPIILEEMNHQMLDALVISPEGYGSITCVESGQHFQNKAITLKMDQPLAVSKIYLDDHFGENLSILINDQAYDFVRQGTGYAKELVIEWDGVINSKGITIVVAGDPGNPPSPAPKVYPYPPDTEVTEVVDAYNVIPAVVATELAGIDIVNPVGDTWYITNTHNFDYLKVDNVDFGSSGTKIIYFTVRSDVGGSIEVVLDSVSGELVGECEIPKTDGEWQVLSFEITKIVGQHNIILRFAGNSTANLMDLVQFRFLPDDGRLDRSGWTATASDNSAMTIGFLDDDLTTRWHGGYQRPGKWILLDMKQDQTFDQIILESKLSPNDSPRGFKVYLATDAEGPNFDEAISSGGTELGLGVTDINFSVPQVARYIKLVLTEEDLNHYFSIYEMNVVNSRLQG